MDDSRIDTGASTLITAKMLIIFFFFFNCSEFSLLKTNHGFNYQYNKFQFYRFIELLASLVNYILVLLHFFLAFMWPCMPQLTLSHAFPATQCR